MSPLRVRTWHRRSSSLIKAYFDTCVFQARRLRFSSCSTEELANIKVRSLAAAKATTIGKLNIRGPVVHTTLVCSALAVYV